MRPSAADVVAANPVATVPRVPPQTVASEHSGSRPPVTAYVGVGGNLGDALGAVQSALAALAQVPGVHGLRASSLYRSAPVDASGPDFINAVAELQTTLTAPDLLTALQAIEHAAGRERPYRNAPRTLDLDVLLYGAAQVLSLRLTLPHPRWRERAFVLLPLQELAAQWVTAADLAAVADQPIARLGVTAPDVP